MLSDIEIPRATRLKARTFLKRHSRPKGACLQVDNDVLEKIGALKLPFTAKNYYAFCDKYLDDDASEALFLDENEKIFREIATDYDTFKYLAFLRQFYEAPSFCDLGCGIGNVLHYAAKLGYSSFGYEINRFLEPVHKKIKAEVLYADLLTANLNLLKKADVIYLYRPINDNKLMNKLLRQVWDCSRKDAIVCYNYPHSRKISGYTSLELAPHDDMVLLIKG